MKMTNYVPPGRPYAGINKSDRRRWTSTILGAVLVLATIGVLLFTWGWIEQREDSRVNSRIFEDDRGPELRKAMEGELK